MLCFLELYISSTGKSGSLSSAARLALLFFSSVQIILE